MVFKRFILSSFLCLSLIASGAVTANAQPPVFTPLKTYTFGQSLSSTGYDTYARDAAFDDFGNVYLTGGTENQLAAVACPKRFLFGARGDTDSFIVKLNRRGTLIWCAVIGGPQYDRNYNIEVKSFPATPSSAAYNLVLVNGRAGAGMPTTPGALSTVFMGGDNPMNGYGPQDGLVQVFKDFDPANQTTQGNFALQASSYQGGNSQSPTRHARFITVSGTLFVASFSSITTSTELLSPGYNGILTNAPKGGEDALVAMMRSTDLSGIWATFVGGNDVDSHTGSIAIIPPDSKYSRARIAILTATRSTDIQFPQQGPPLQTLRRGTNDFLLAVLNPLNGIVTHTTLLGGSDLELVETQNLSAIPELVPGEGSRLLVHAQTKSADFPFTMASYQSGHGGNGGMQNYQGDGVLASVHADLKMDDAYFAVPLGGSGGEAIEGGATTPDGKYILVAGATDSPNFPVTPNANQGTKSSVFDSFISIFKRKNSGGVTLIYSSYFGGTNQDYGRFAALPPVNGVPLSFAIGGQTMSPTLPLAPTYTKAPNWDGLLTIFHLQ